MRFDHGTDRRKQQGTGAGGSPVSASFNTSFTDISQGVFGTDVSGTTDVTTDETITSQLSIDEAGIMSFIDDILSGNQGLASIFSEEAASGLFSTTAAAQASGNLLSQIAGELAKLTGVKTETKEGTVSTVTERDEAGLFGQFEDITGLEGAEAFNPFGAYSVGPEFGAAGSGGLF